MLKLHLAFLSRQSKRKVIGLQRFHLFIQKRTGLCIIVLMVMMKDLSINFLCRL